MLPPQPLPFIDDQPGSPAPASGIQANPFPALPGFQSPISNLKSKRSTLAFPTLSPRIPHAFPMLSLMLSHPHSTRNPPAIPWLSPRIQYAFPYLSDALLFCIQHSAFRLSPAPSSVILLSSSHQPRPIPRLRGGVWDEPCNISGPAPPYWPYLRSGHLLASQSTPNQTACEVSTQRSPISILPFPAENAITFKCPAWS